MKKLIFLSSLLFSFNTFACLMLPPIKCDKPTVKKDVKEFESLLKRVNEYQKFLDLSITGKPTHSCFNQPFASTYGKNLLRNLKLHKGMACQNELQRVHRSFNGLISTESDEFKATKTDSRIALTEKGKILKVKIRNFFE